MRGGFSPKAAACHLKIQILAVGPPFSLCFRKIGGAQIPGGRPSAWKRTEKVSNPWENTDLSKILKIECGSVDVPVFGKTVFFWRLCGVFCAFTKHSAKNKNFARLNMWAQKQEKKGVRGRRFGTSGSAS